VDQGLASGVIQAVAALGAMAAALFSYFSIRHAKRAQQSSVYLGMAARYDSPEMRDSCNALLAWKRQYGDAFADVWSARMATREPEAVQVNTARRIVARHFLNIAKLRKIDAIDPEAARLLADCYGLNVFYQIAAPLNRRIASDVDDFEELTRRLRKIRRSYAKGELIDSF
jgi:hypothetical protein